MKVFSFFFFFFFFLLPIFPLSSLLRETKAAAAADNNNGNIYIVYMGAKSSSNAAQLLNSVIKRNQNALVHNYKHGFKGFAARLSEEEAHTIAQKPGVVSVFPDPVLQLHTTRSWDFLHYQTDLKIDSSISQSNGTDAIVGILDTGVWPESESFNDKGLGPIPSRWKGTCVEGHAFSSSNCNRKIIGARYYSDPDDEMEEDQTPRDNIGHGTHVASTVAGISVPAAAYYGLAVGTAKGGSPESRIAMYRVCTSSGCRGSAILAAFDDAIADGVDVLSLSLGSSAFFKLDFSTDPIALGAFHAVENGITVVCSAGNAGPDPNSVVNAAPWILTVAASTIDRDFESDVVLGNNKSIKGEAINFANIEKLPVYPLIYGLSAKANSSKEDEARNCNTNAIDGNKIKGKIVLCENDDSYTTKDELLEGIKSHGGIGVILVDDLTRAVPSNYGSNPMTVISSNDAADILSYINSTSNPVATILPTITVEKYNPAPAVAYFSSRGPSYNTKSLLKPDIAAPGVAILAAWIGNDTSKAPPGQEPSHFNVISGTSMACPHVSGIVASVKSRNPTWSPSAIRSAIMTTASQTNNMRTPITTHTRSIATPYDYGAGEVSQSGPLKPGLVYEMDTIEYLQFLCNYGYDLKKIKLVSSKIPEGFTCPTENKSSNADLLISNMNYPSIAISKFDGKQSRIVNRTVTNVGGGNDDDEETVYIASVDAPSGLNVKVSPERLEFKKKNEKLSYQVVFSSSSSTFVIKEDVFGSITWSNGKFKVRSPFVVSKD